MIEIINRELIDRKLITCMKQVLHALFRVITKTGNSCSIFVAILLIMSNRG